MIRLLGTELHLIFKQKRTYYGILAALLIELFIVVGAWYQGNELIEILLSNLSEAFILEGKLMNGHLVMYIVLNSLWFNLPLIMMIIVSGFLCNDYKDRTIQTVMLQSINKQSYIRTKFASAVIFALILLAIFFVSALILAYGIFGTGDLITYLNSLNFFESGDALSRIALSYLSGAFIMIAYAIASISLAIIFKEMTITWIACAVFLILNNLLLKIDFGAVDVWIYPKLIDTWQYFFYFEIQWKDILLNHLILGFYIMVFYFIGVRIFMKRDIG